MQTTMAVEDFKRMLPELLDQLTPGDEVLLTRNHETVARLVMLVSEPAKLLPRPGPGLAKGSILYMAPDFDAPLDCMKEYME